jgi:hypothetical protein
MQSAVVEVCRMLAMKVQHIMEVGAVVVEGLEGTDLLFEAMSMEIIRKHPPDMEQPQ